MSKVKVSILTPTYNTPSTWLRKCFDSILNQTYPVYEIIVADDGSTSQETIDTLDEYSAKYPNLFKLIRCSHIGVGKIRNVTLDAASGDYILLLDSDDFFKENFVENLVKLTADGTMDIVFGGYTLVTNSGTSEVYNAPSTETFNKIGALTYFEMDVTSKLIRTDYIRALNFNFIESKFFETFPILISSYFATKKIAYSPEYGYCVRQREDSTARNRKTYYTLLAEEIDDDEIQSKVKNVLNAVPEKEDILKYIFIENCVMICWLFCCFSTTKNKILVVNKMMKIISSNGFLNFSLKNAYKSFGHKKFGFALVAVFKLSYFLGIQQLVSLVLSFFAKILLTLKGIG